MVLENKKGQVVFFVLMLGILIVVVSFGLVPAVKTFVDDARSPSTNSSVGLDCSNDSISDYKKSQCVITDLSLPYFFLGLIGIALLIIFAKGIVQ